MKTNRVSFNSVDIVPAFGLPVYIQQSEISTGMRQHAYSLLLDNNTGRSVRSDIAVQQVSYRVLIHTQMNQFTGLLSIDDRKKFEIVESYVRKIEPGQSVKIDARDDTTFSGVMFFHDPGCDMNYRYRGADSWYSGIEDCFAETNILNSTEFTFTPTEGNLTIYPSALLDLSLSPNTTNTDVYVLEYYLK